MAMAEPAAGCPAQGVSGRARGGHVAMRLLLIVLALFSAAPLARALPAEESEVERLERQVGACEQALVRRQGTAELARRQQLLDAAKARRDRAYGELGRLHDELAAINQEEAAANAALDAWSSGDEGDTLEEATARVANAVRARWLKEEEIRLAEEEKERANQEHEDEELKLTLLQSSLAEQGRDADSIKAECDRLRRRLEAARAAAGASPSPSPTAGWGLEEGRSWTEEAPTPTPSAAEWWHEEGSDPGGRDDPTPTPPGTTPRRTPPALTPTPSGPARPPNRTPLDIGGGPYHEFAALCRLGWASVLASYSIGPADASIADHLRMAGEHMRAANATTFDPLRAWPDWAGRKNHYDALAARLPTTSDVFRRQLAQELDSGWSGAVDDLAWQLAGELQHRESCDSHYARLGYALCSGQQSLQIAEVAERDGDRALSQRAAREGRDRLLAARRELEALPVVRLATGRCIDLGTVLAELSSSRGDLGREVEAANAAFAEAIRLLAGALAPQQPVRLGSVSATPWTWGATVNVGVLFTPREPFTVTGVWRCVADWSPDPTPCQAEVRMRTLHGKAQSFCCTGRWLTGQIAVPGQGTFVVQWPDTGQNRLRVPAGTTVNLGTLFVLAAAQEDFDNDAVFALIRGTDSSGRAVELESPAFMAGDEFPSYQEMCRKMGSGTTSFGR